jgi:hypothetical protein
MDKTTSEAVHANPVWRDRSNFIIRVLLPDLAASEQLWARKLSDHEFEICCIPFLTYGIALGDVVETDEDYNVQRVVRSSGRSVFRIWFGSSDWGKDVVAADLAGLGSLVEWSSRDLMALDAPNPETAKKVTEYLDKGARQGHFIYETG